MDAFVIIRDFVINFIYSLPENFTSFILRMGIMLIFLTSFLFLAWYRLPWRTVFSQVCIAFLAIVFSLYVPVNDFRNSGKEALAFMVIISLLCIFFLPNWLPYYLTPRLGNQMKLKRIIKKVIWTLFILQLILRVKA